MAKLVLVRHGVTEWNNLGLWTGWAETDLIPEGIEQARRAGEAIKDTHFDLAYASDLSRSQKTLEIIKEVLGYEIPTTISPEIKERDYGDLTGKNKWEIKKEYGEEQFNKWRRSWDEEIPNGEHLKKVYERVIPYFEKEILPQLILGKNILVSAHGNSLRALAKKLDNVADSDVHTLEINTGEAWVYDIDPEGKVTNKQVRATNANKV